MVQARTEGVFQLESRRYEKLHEGTEAAEPGRYHCRYFPVSSRSYGFHPTVYLKGKNDPRDCITYECPQLEPILSPTYGCIVYQEQVMQIVRDLAGYTHGSKRSGAPCHE